MVFSRQKAAADPSTDCLHQFLKAHEVQYPLQIIRQRDQTPFGPHLLQTFEQEMRVAHAPLDGSERMLGQCLAEPRLPLALVSSARPLPPSNARWPPAIARNAADAGNRRDTVSTTLPGHTAGGPCRRIALWQNPVHAVPASRRTHPGIAPDFPLSRIPPATREKATSVSGPSRYDDSCLKQSLRRSKRFPMTKEFSHRLSLQATRDGRSSSAAQLTLFRPRVPELRTLGLLL